MNSKPFTYRGNTIEKPENISGRCAKQVMDLLLIPKDTQSVINIISNQINGARAKAFFEMKKQDEPREDSAAQEMIDNWNSQF